MKKCLLICLLGACLSGCGIHGDVDWEGWVDWVQDGAVLVDEVLEILETEDPPEVPDSDSPAGPLFYPPEYAGVTEAAGPPGVQLCSESYVPGHDPDKWAGSIALGWMELTRQSDGRTVRKCWGELLIESPDGTFSWRDYDRETNCKHLYTTGYKQNEAGQIDCPLADGSRRGRAFMEFSEEGLWDLVIMSRCTTNRTSQAWVGMTLHDGQTHWMIWNQRGYGVGEEGYIPVPIAQGLMFKKTEVAGGSSGPN